MDGNHKIILTPNTIHYAKEVDENGKFVKWIKDPNKKQSYKEICEIKLKKAYIKDPENGFIRSLIKFFNSNKGLSNLQMQRLDEFLET